MPIMITGRYLLYLMCFDFKEQLKPLNVFATLVSRQPFSDCLPLWQIKISASAKSSEAIQWRFRLHIHRSDFMKKRGKYKIY